MDEPAQGSIQWIRLFERTERAGHKENKPAYTRELKGVTAEGQGFKERVMTTAKEIELGGAKAA